MSVRQCGAIQPGSGLVIRLAEYWRGDTQSLLVTGCGPRGTACSPLATLDHTLPPAISLADGTLIIEVLGGYVRHTHAQGLNVGGNGYDVRIRHIRGRPSDQWKRHFYRRIGLPYSNWQPDPCAQHRAAHPDQFA